MNNRVSTFPATSYRELILITTTINLPYSRSDNVGGQWWGGNSNLHEFILSAAALLSACIFFCCPSDASGGEVFTNDFMANRWQ